MILLHTSVPFLCHSNHGCVGTHSAAAARQTERVQADLQAQCRVSSRNRHGGTGAPFAVMQRSSLYFLFATPEPFSELSVRRYAGLVALPPGLVGQVNKHNPHVMELELSRYAYSKAAAEHCALTRVHFTINSVLLQQQTARLARRAGRAAASARVACQVQQLDKAARGVGQNEQAGNSGAVRQPDHCC